MSEYVWSLTHSELHHKMNFAFEQGLLGERERIIALLKTRLDDCYEKNDMGGWSFMPELFIALIEEEN